MVIRNTSGYVASQVQYYSQVRTSNLGFLQFQASTGLKHSRPSDDPLATERLFNLKRTVNQLDSDKGIMDNLEHTLNLSVANLTEGHQIVRSVQRIAIEARQADPAELPIFANEVEDLMGRLVSLANAVDGDRYQYAGQADKTIPYVRNPAGDIPPYLYQGAKSTLEVNVSDNVRTEALRVGSEIFGSTERGTTFFKGETGARAGTGSDNGIGYATLQVTHGTTTFQPGSGVAAGTDSANLDTAIGQTGVHQLTLVDTSGTGASGTVQLNDGLEYAWTSADDNLEITSPTGVTIYLDTTSIAAGFNGTVDITSTGFLSVDGGVTQTAIDFSGNQNVYHSDNGTVTNVDSSGITQTGDESLEYVGASDLFTTLQQLRDDLLNTRNLVGSDWDDAIIRRDADIERHANRIIETVGEQSVSLESIVALRERNRAYHLEVNQIIDDVENADLTDVVLQLQQEQNLLEYTYAVSSSILNQSILDYLR